MKASVLLATHDKQFSRDLQAGVADLCRLELSASSGQAYDRLAHKQFDLVVVDIMLPDLDGLELVHALRHAAKQNPLVVTLGRLDSLVYLAEPKKWESVVVPRSTRSAVEVLRARLDPSAARTIRDVRYTPKKDTFFVAFRNGKTYELSRKVIEADDGTPIVGEPKVIHSGEAFEVRQKSANVYQVAWDFVLYHQEPSYPYHKGKAEQKQAETGRAQRIGQRVLRARQERRWTLRELADRTGIHPPNLSRLEAGTHVPSLETLERVAEALGLRVADLLAE